MTCLTAPAQAGERRWCESTTPTFQMISDLPLEDQAALIHQLGLFEQVAAPLLPGEPVGRPTALRLILFSTRARFLQLTGKRQFAGYLQPSLETNRLLVGPIRGDIQITTLHEFAHYLLRNRTGVSLPMWFDEGLATLLGHTRFSNDVVELGWIPQARLQDRTRFRVRQRSPLSIMRKTLATTTLEGLSTEQINAFYDWSLMLVHYLYFGAYQSVDPVDGTGRTSLEAFLAEGGSDLSGHLGQSNRELLNAVESHVQRWSGPVKQPLPPSQRPAAKTALTTPAHTCLDDFSRDLALAGAVHIQNPARARELLEPYLDAYPDDVRLLVSLAKIELAADRPEETLALVSTALSLAPLDAEATVLAADLLVRNCLFTRDPGCIANWQEAAGIYRRAIRQDPSRYDGILGLGLAQLHSGHSGEAVNYLKVAYERAPWAAVINYYLGESLRLAGDSRAVEYLTNARNWAALDLWRILAEESLRRIEEVGGNAGEVAQSEGG